MANQKSHQLIKDIEKELVKVRAEIRDSYRELDWRIQSLQAKAVELENQLDKIEQQLIPPSEYKILKQIIFGAVGLILVAVVTALIGKVIVS